MNTHNKNQQQIEFEVFPKEDKFNYTYLSGVRNEPTQETAPINVVFSYQSVIIIFICAMMLLIASFTLGVEKGKLIAKNSFGLEKMPVASETTASATSVGLAKETMGTLNTVKIQTPTVAKDPVVDVNASSTTSQAPGAARVAPMNSGYTIQVASIESEKAAKNLSESLIKKGMTSFTKQSGKYIIVLAGNFNNKEEALGMLKELKKTYTDCFVKKI